LAVTAATPESLPEEPSDEIEVALVGRSNVGKSSLLNALANSYGERTARTSERPGETQAVTFYRVGKAFRLVDLPGYGFAFADEQKSKEMSAVMRAYLQQRKALKHVVLLVDARHGFKAADTEMAQWLHKHCAAKLHVCLTKCDTIEPDQLKRVASMAKDDAAKFTKEPLLLVSALKKQGIDVLRREIARFAVPSVYRKLILRFQRRENASLGNDNAADDGDAAVAADDALAEQLLRKKEEKRERYRVHVAPSRPKDDATDADDDADFDDMMATQEAEVRQALQARGGGAKANKAAAPPPRAASAPPTYRRFEGGERSDTGAGNKYATERRVTRGDGNDKRRHSFGGGFGRERDQPSARRFDTSTRDKPRTAVDGGNRVRAGDLLPSRFPKTSASAEKPRRFGGERDNTDQLRRRFDSGDKSRRFDGERRFGSDNKSGRKFGGERRFGGDKSAGGRFAGGGFQARRDGGERFGGDRPRRFDGARDERRRREARDERPRRSVSVPPPSKPNLGLSFPPKRIDARGRSDGESRRDERPRRSLSGAPKLGLRLPSKRTDTRTFGGGGFASKRAAPAADAERRAPSTSPPPGGRRAGSSDPRLARLAFRERKGERK
jgi:ribosome biogenesis GTP-binding protein YsxC/EngB